MENDLPKPMAVLWWAITLAWAALIFYLSTQTFGSDFTRGLLAWTLDLLHFHFSPRTFRLFHDTLRRLAHLTEYAIFALLLYGPPGEKSRRLWRPRRAVLCIVGAALYSLTDEFHQWLVPERQASLLDWGLDTLGAALAMLVPYTQEQISLLNSNHPFSNG
jgi:VanZ family protein